MSTVNRSRSVTHLGSHSPDQLEMSWNGKRICPLLNSGPARHWVNSPAGAPGIMNRLRVTFAVADYSSCARRHSPRRSRPHHDTGCHSYRDGNADMTTVRTMGKVSITPPRDAGSTSYTAWEQRYSVSRAELFGGGSAELGISTGVSGPTAAMLIRVRAPLTSNSPTTSHRG
jgi:hypothetical protein